MMNAALLFAETLAPALVAFQDVLPTSAPTPLRTMNLTSPVWGYAIMALLAGAIVGVSLLPSKRGHQD